MTTATHPTREERIEAMAKSDAEFDGRAWLAMGRVDRERYLARSARSYGALVAMGVVVGESDLTAFGTFSAAFAEARRLKLLEFHYKGQSYHTRTVEEERARAAL